MRPDSRGRGLDARAFACVSTAFVVAAVWTRARSPVYRVRRWRAAWTRARDCVYRPFRPKIPPSGDSRSTALTMNIALPGRSAMRRMKYGYQASPKGVYTRTL